MSNHSLFRSHRRLVLVRLAALIGVCGLAGAQESPVESGARAELPPFQSDVAPDVDPDTYQIGPGDQLNVFVWRMPELSTTIPVRPDGRISTPLVEDLIAVGKTPTQLARDIESVLSTYIRLPQVTVIVQGFVGTIDAQIRVLGQVGNPGPVAYREGMTLLDVIFQAGGLSPFAAGNRARLVRNVDGVSQERRVRLRRLVEKGDLDENVPVQPGDIVIVPEAAF